MKKLKLLKYFSLLITLFICGFVSCGIEKHYYLPQISPSNVRMVLNTDAYLTIPNTLNSSEYAEYSPAYCIYYRIYLSNQDIPSEVLPELMSSINSTLLNDYNHFYSFTDPLNYTALLNPNSFKNRNYHELNFLNTNINSIITKAGGAFQFHFPSFAQPPVIKETNRINPNTQEPFEHVLYRNSGTDINGIDFTPEPDRYFYYTEELLDNIDANNKINTDAVRPSNTSGTDRFAYVSIYIVAIGADPTKFTRIFSKPTHIGVFKLPRLN